MKLVVGLGNPGRKYESTRHNVGFELLGLLGKKYASGPVRAKFEGEIAEAVVADQKLLLLCPLTYMNESGRSVLAARDFYKVADSDILVVCDDFSIPAGKLRFRPQGSPGGQKGLADILNRLGSQQIPRLRIGIGPLPAHFNDAAGYVLGKITKEERELIDPALDQAVSGTVDWLQKGIDYCMNQYN